MAYIVHSRTARAMQRDPVSKKKRRRRRRKRKRKREKRRRKEGRKKGRKEGKKERKKRRKEKKKELHWSDTHGSLQFCLPQPPALQSRKLHLKSRCRTVFPSAKAPSGAGRC